MSGIGQNTNKKGKKPQPQPNKNDSNLLTNYFQSTWKFLLIKTYANIIYWLHFSLCMERKF